MYHYFLLCAAFLFSSFTFAEEVNTIIITSSKIEEPLTNVATSVSVVTQEQIENSGANTLPDLLRNTGSIHVSNSGGDGKASSLRIRGEEGYRTSIMIDGVDVSDPTGTQVGPQIQHLMLGNEIDRIEILRGPQGFIYGADAGGVVNVISRTGVGPTKGNVTFSSGSYGTKKANANLSGGNRHGDFFVNVSSFSTEGFNARETDPTEDKDGYDNQSFHTKFSLTPSDKLRIQLVARVTDAESEFDRCYDASTFSTTDRCRGAYDQSTGKLSLDYKGNTLRHHVAYSMTDIHRRNHANDTVSYDTEGDVERFEYLGNYQRNTSRITYGYDYEREFVNNSGEKSDRDQQGYYVELATQFDDRLFIKGGARYDDNETFGDYTSTRLSLAYLQKLQNGHEIKYRSSYGTGFRAPSLFESSYNSNSFVLPPASDVTLKEEISEGYDIGVDYFHKSGFAIKLSYFNQAIEDQIEYDSDSRGYLQSEGKSRSEGGELFIDVPLSISWHLYSNYTYNDARNADDSRRIRRPRHLGNVGAIYYGMDNDLVIASNYRFSNDSIDSGNVELSDYQVMDININYRLNATFKLQGGVRNLFDSDYVEVSTYNVAERSLYLGFTANF